MTGLGLESLFMISVHGPLSMWQQGSQLVMPLPLLGAQSRARRRVLLSCRDMIAVTSIVPV